MKSNTRWVVILPMVFLGLLVLGVWHFRDHGESPESRPETQTRPDVAKPAPASKDQNSSKSSPLNPVTRNLIIEEFKRDLEEDPTLAATMLTLTREDVMEMGGTPEENEEFWEYIQYLQAEARKKPVKPILGAPDEK